MIRVQRDGFVLKWSDLSFVLLQVDFQRRTEVIVSLKGLVDVQK